MIPSAIGLIKKSEDVRLVTHIDADGLSAGAIMSSVLDHLDIGYEVQFVRQLEPHVIEEIEPGELTIFTDLGSGHLDLLKPRFRRRQTLIIDHHLPVKGWKGLCHLNAHLMGWDGGQEISGAGMVYLVARELGLRNLSKNAIVGAVGDMQTFWGRLAGKNIEILHDAVAGKMVSVRNDLLLYGRETRPLFKSLQYFTDPYVPGVSNSEAGSTTLLKALSIRLKQNGKWRTLNDLGQNEKERICTELVKRALNHAPPGLKRYVASLIVGEVYELLGEARGSPLRDADEFSTALNACGRNDKPEIGFAIAKGDREDAYKDMTSLIRLHRRNLARGIGFVEETGIKHRKGLQYFDARGEVKDTLVGTIAGMLLGSELTDPYKPLIGLADAPTGDVKVSARCSRLLVLNGINMATIIKEVAASVGGVGGGHAVACGAYVPPAKLDVFLGRLGDVL